jgi:hypothetical protein
MKNSDSSLMNCGLPSITRANLNCNRHSDSNLNIKHTVSNKPSGPNESKIFIIKKQKQDVPNADITTWKLDTSEDYTKFI